MVSDRTIWHDNCCDLHHCLTAGKSFDQQGTSQCKALKSTGLAAALTWSSLVSLESRKGTCVELGSARALMHIPSAVSDRLMLLASLALSPAAFASRVN